MVKPRSNKPLWGLYNLRDSRWYLEPRFSSIGALRSFSRNYLYTLPFAFVPRRAGEYIDKCLRRSEGRREQSQRILQRNPDLP